MDVKHPLIHHVKLRVPALNPRLQGLRLAHLTDLHIDRHRRRHKTIARLLKEAQPDLILLTGDYMSYKGDEPVAAQVMTELANSFEATLGVFGVFGNHDTPLLRKMIRDVPIRWLEDVTQRVADLPMTITGMHNLKTALPDSMAMLTRSNGQAPPVEVAPAVEEPPAVDEDASPILKLMLCHHPTYLPVAADLGMDLLFSGHTHGGQCRLPFKRALVNSTDLPVRLTSGILRHRDTLALVSRGLGEVNLPLRVFCPPQLPIYELTKGELPGEIEAGCQHVHNTQPW